MGGGAIASANAYAREIRRDIVRLAAVALVTAAAVFLLAWHQTQARQLREHALFRHYAALAAIERLEWSASALRSPGTPAAEGAAERAAGAFGRLHELAGAEPAGGPATVLLADVEAAWDEVREGGDRSRLRAAIQALEGHHAAAAEALAGPAGDPDGALPWGTLLPVAALVGAGGLAVHRLVRRIARAADGQRAVEDALRAGEAGHARAQAIAGLGHWSWDMTTGAVTRSAETYRILGWTPETLGASVGDFVQVVHPDDRDNFHARTREAAERRGPFAFEFRIVRPDGTVRHVHSRGEVGVDPDTGAPTAMVGTIQDVTDRKAAEEAVKASERRFRQIFDNAAFGITLGDTQDRVIEVNAAFARFTGYAPDELRGRSLTDLCHPDDLASYRALVEQARAGATGTIERRYLRKDGTAAWGRLTLGPIRAGHGPHEYAIGIVEDIGARREMEAALNEREELLRQMTESIDEVFWLKDASGTGLLYISPAFETIFGRSTGSLRANGGTWHDAVHPDDRARLLAIQQEGRKAGVPYAAHYRIVRPDGTERVIHGRGYPVRDAAGKVYRWAGVAADVTELHRLQSALAASERRLRQVTEVMGEVFWMEDERCERTFYISPSYERVWGRSCESLYENPMSWSDTVHPDDRERVRAAMAWTRAEGRPYEVTYRIVRPDGTERVIRSRAHPMEDAEKGAPPRWVGVSSDVTEFHRLESALLEKEQRLREVTENIGEVFWIADVEAGRVTYVSPAYETVWGRACEDVYRDPQAWFAAIHPDDRAGLAAAMAAATRAGEACETHYRIVRPDGAERHIRDRGHPVRDADGKVRRYVGVAADVTEQRAAEEDRRRYQEELAHVTRLATMGQMASELAHEINQPLSAIANYAQGSLRRLEAAGGGTDAGLMRSLEQIAGQAARAGAIVRHLRELVVKGRGQRTLEDMNALVTAAARLLEPEARRHGVRLRLDLGESVDPVEVDRIQVDQVVINLTQNAIEALADRPGTREVVLSTRGGAGGAVAVAVADNGPGLPEANRERLFGPFFTTKPHGLGMGLAIGRSIVEAHGGELVAEAGPDGGAVFRFTVPAARGARDA